MLDGVLSPAETEEVRLFLLQHPDIEEEFDGMEEVVLEKAPVTSSFDFLKKDPAIHPQTGINQDNLDEVLAAEMEGDLTEEEQEELRVYARAHPGVSRDRKLMNATRLPDDLREYTFDKSLVYGLATEAGEPVDDGNFDEYLVAALEGDLDDEQNRPYFF